MNRPRYTVEELERQTEALPADLPGLLRDASADARNALPDVRKLDRIVALGSGDSLNAAMACALAFSRGGAVEYCPMSASEFTRYPPARTASPDRTAVIGVSASGGNPSIVATLTAAREQGCPTIALTGNADSPLSAAAETTLHVGIGPTDPSPGIRTYQASLVAMLALAGDAGLADAERLVEAVRRSVTLAGPAIRPLADAWADAPVAMVVGSGPGLGTARHVAAKITEGAGMPAMGVEIEDWWHVHRFGHARQSPVLFIATPGRGRDAVVAMAERTTDRRPVFMVAAEDDQGASETGAGIIPVAPGVPEACGPLVDHVFAGLLAAGLAHRGDVLPFANP